MKKKSHRKPHKKGRNKKPYSIEKFADLLSKPMVLGMSVALAMMIMIYATYAWNTAADEKNNHFKGARLSAVIDETFVPNMQWQPGTKTDKIIQVTNTGNAAAFVRLSLDEYLLSFQVDTENKVNQPGTGNLTIVDDEAAATKASIKFDTFSDWTSYEKGAAVYPVPYGDKQFYLFQETWKEEKFQFPEGSIERNEQPFQYLSIQFTARAKNDPAEIEEDDWFYYDGYFYYAAVLYPGETSMPLTKEVLLKSSLANAYKGSLYVLDVHLDALDIMKGSLEAGWDLEEGDAVHQVLAEYIRE